MSFEPSQGDEHQLTEFVSGFLKAAKQLFDHEEWNLIRQMRDWTAPSAYGPAGSRQ